MFRRRNAHADPHALMSELLETIEECLASADGEAARIAESAKGADTAVAFQQVEQAAAQPSTAAEPGIDAR